MRCHEEHKVAKWWGYCNDAKTALDRCFRVRWGAAGEVDVGCGALPSDTASPPAARAQEEKKWRITHNRKVGLPSWEPTVIPDESAPSS